MTTLREAAQQALEALEIGYESAQVEAAQFHAAMAGYKPQRHAAMDADVEKIARAITALRAALAEPVQEPVAWMMVNPTHPRLHKSLHWKPQTDWHITWESVPLYVAPPQRKPLSEEEILKAAGWDRAEMYMKLTPNFPVAEAKKETLKNARAIERALWEKNT